VNTTLECRGSPASGVPLQRFEATNSPLVSGDGVSGRLPDGGGVAGRVDARVGDTLEKLIHSHAPVGLVANPPPQVEALGVGLASTAVDDQICVDRFAPALRVQPQAVTAAALLEPGYFRVERSSMPRLRCGL